MFYMATQTATQFTRLTLDLHPPVARISLQNPPVNVIDVPMMGELTQALAELDARNDISAPDKIHDMLAKFHGVIRALVATKKVTIAAVHGHCLGGGAELAMVCDLVYTTQSAPWGFPEIKLGCYPPVACTALAALVGAKRAADLILTGRTISGAEAASMGLANGAVPDGALVKAVEESVGRLVKLSPAALALTKKAIYAWDSMHFDKGLARAEKMYLEELMRTEDANEGITAFLQKREPVWKGK